MQTCFQCGSELVRQQSAEIFQCDECAARLAHGERMPRVVVQPHTDKRFVVVTISEPNVLRSDGSTPPEPVQFVLDRALARMLGHALLSVS